MKKEDLNNIIEEYKETQDKKLLKGLTFEELIKLIDSMPSSNAIKACMAQGLKKYL